MSTVPPELVALRERAAVLCDLDRIGALLFWDQNTMMPPHGATARGDHAATLQTVAHERITDPELARLLDVLEPWAAGEDPDADDVRLIRELRRDVEKAIRVPTSLAADMSRAAALGQAAWEAARAAADYGRFRDALARHLELRHRYVECFTGYEHPYDVLLDDFEPEMTTARLKPLFASLREGLVPLVEATAGPLVLPFGGEVDVESQRRAVMMVLEGVGFDPDGWRLDVAPHPFAQALGRGDVRVTTRYDMHDFAGAYFGALHEFGHGLYEAQIPERLGRSPLGSPVSLGVHESQSRLWENLVGRSRAFCTWVAPQLDGDPARLRRRRRGGALPPCQHRPPQPDPRRGGRDDVQPAHRPALRARARAGGGDAQRSTTSRTRGTRACTSCSASTSPTTRRGCSRTSTGAPGWSATSRRTRSGT